VVPWRKGTPEISSVLGWYRLRFLVRRSMGGFLRFTRPLMPRPDSPARARRRELPGGNLGLSLTWKLPLQFAVMLVLVMVSLSAIAFAEVRRSTIEANADRIQRVNQTFAQSAAATQADWRTHVANAAAHPAVIEILRDPNGEGSDVFSLFDDALTGDTLNHLEIWGSDGAAVLASSDADVHPEHSSQASLLLLNPPVDSVLTGPVYRAGPEIHFWVVAPVLDPLEGQVGAPPRGYVALRRRILVPVASEAAIQDLLGQSVRVFLTTRERDVWVGLLRATPARSSAATPAVGGFFTFRDEEGGKWVAHEAAVQGTPWVLVTARPESAVMAPVRTFVARSGLAAAILFAMGFMAAGLMGRRLIRPLRKLSVAARALAGGDYDRRAGVTRSDEVGQLAATFNQMASEVQRAHAALESKAGEARKLAQDLAKAYLRLREAGNEAERLRTEADEAAAMALAARDEAEAANRAKSHFLATISHEIRTPLNAIMGYSDLLGAEIEGSLNTEQRRKLQGIARSSEHLKGLVDDLLDLSKIEAGEFEVQSVAADLADVMAEVMDFSHPEADSRRIALALEPVPRGAATYNGDPRRVLQILGNLLSNAMKFTPPGGRISVTGGVTEGDGGAAGVFVTVEDNGQGIEAEDIEKIFDPFVQLDAGSTGSRDGAGLGLPISRHLAHLMGGRLSVQSEPGVGSRFTLWLPGALATDPVPHQTPDRSGGEWTGG
jgi:signal transduction histidine kinase